MNHKMQLALSLIAILSFIMGNAMIPNSDFKQSGNDVFSPDSGLGQPGISYRYLSTIGVPFTPYIEDFVHINRPWGLFTDTSNNIYVVEQRGCRMLKFNSSGKNLLSIGDPGQCDTGDYTFNATQDVTLDGNNMIWIADRHRVVQYSQTGNFIQQQPAENPWEAGNDNERFDNVHGIAFDSAGRMFVSDTYNHRIQVYEFISGSPVYSTTIGITDIQGSDNAHFNRPWRIDIDGLDRLFVADSGNNRVQRCIYSAGWSCSTLDSGLSNPQGIFADQSNNIFIADTENGRIRKCTSAGACGNFKLGTHGWNYDLAADMSGNVYGAAAYEMVVGKYSSSGNYVGNFAGVEGVPYNTDNIHFNRPRIAIDASDNIIIAEEHGQRLIKLDSNGTPMWAVGVPGVDANDNAHFNYPHGVAVDNNGQIYVADSCRVKIFSANGGLIATLGTGCGSGDYQFNWASGIAVDNNNNLYVADDPNHRVMIYNSNRVKIGQIGTTGVCSSSVNGICHPLGLETDIAGNLYIADAGNCRVQKYNNSLVYQMTFGNSGGCSDSLLDLSPEDIAVDTQGRVYVSNWNFDRVQVFSSTGDYLTTIGGIWGRNSSQFKFTSGVDIDSKGHVYISDFGNSRIQVFSLGVPAWSQRNLNGFGNRWNEAIWSLEPFGGYLYAGATNWQDGSQIWRSPDGISWTSVTTAGFLSSYQNNNKVILDLVEFDGMLYAGTGNWGGAIGQIWKTSDGVNWVPEIEDGFGNFNNTMLGAFSVYNNTLYAGAFNAVDGAEIWSKTSGGSWSPQVTGGLGNTNTKSITGLMGFNSYLYVAAENSINGCEVWRMDGGHTWEKVITGGFGQLENIYTGGFAIFNNHLLLGTQNETTGAQIWKTSNGQNWLPVIQDGFGDENNIMINNLLVFHDTLYTTTLNFETGLEVWKTGDGDDWYQINVDGFGDSNNTFSLWNSSAAIFNDHLYLGTYNQANGGEIWMYPHNQIFLPFIQR